jgi:hypothetical protein
VRREEREEEREREEGKRGEGEDEGPPSAVALLGPGPADIGTCSGHRATASVNPG